MEAACQDELDFIMQATNKEFAEKTGRSMLVCLSITKKCLLTLPNVSLAPAPIHVIDLAFK